MKEAGTLWVPLYATGHIVQISSSDKDISQTRLGTTLKASFLTSLPL